MDILDGALARQKKTHSSLGKWLDPFFDLTITIVLVVSFTFGSYGEYGDIMISLTCS